MLTEIGYIAHGIPYDRERVVNHDKHRHASTLELSFNGFLGFTSVDGLDKLGLICSTVSKVSNVSNVSQDSKSLKGQVSKFTPRESLGDEIKVRLAAA